MTSIFSLHSGCVHGASYSCFSATGPVHGPLSYYGGDLVQILCLLQPWCLFFERKTQLARFWSGVHSWSNQPCQGTQTPQTGIPDAPTTQAELFGLGLEVPGPPSSSWGIVCSAILCPTPLHPLKEPPSFCNQHNTCKAMSFGLGRLSFTLGYVIRN